MKFTILKVGLAYIAFIWMLNGFNLLVLLSLIGLFAIIGGIAYLFANSIGLALGLYGQAFESEHSTSFTDTHGLGSDYTNTHSLHNSLSHDIFDSDPLSHDQFNSPSINPANGLPMACQ